MPLQPAEWRAVVGKASNDLASALPPINAYEINKMVPIGLDPANETYQRPMIAADRQALRLAFLAIIDTVIADLTAARNA